MKKGKTLKTPAVFDLIKSMNKTEKIYFKRYLGSGDKKSTIHLQLFEILEKMKVYDVAKIKTTIRTSTVIKQLPVYYNYLYKALLSSLRSFHAKNMDTIRADEMLGEIRILLKKRLLDQSARQIKRARSFFEKRDYRTHLFMLGAFEYNLSIVTMEKNEFEHRKEIIDTRMEQLEYMGSQLKVIALTNELVRIQKIRELHPEADLDQEIKQVSKIFEELRSHVKQESSYFKLFFFGGLQRYSDIQKEPLHSYIYNQIQIEIWEEMPPHMQYSQTAISIILYNFFSKSEELFQYKGIDRFMPMLDRICKKEPELTLKCKVLNHIFMFQRHAIKGDWKEAEVLIKEQKENLENLLEQSVPFYQMHLYQTLALNAFLNEAFEEALEWINKLQEIKNLFTLEQFVFPFKLLEVIIHFEWGNYQYLESLILSISRYMDKFKRLDSERVLEELWLKMMSKTNNINSKRQKKAFCEDMHLEYNQLYSPERMPPNKALTIIKCWLDAKKQDSSLLETWNTHALEISQRIEAKITAINYEID